MLQDKITSIVHTGSFTMKMQMIIIYIIRDRIHRILNQLFTYHYIIKWMNISDRDTTHISVSENQCMSLEVILLLAIFKNEQSHIKQGELNQNDLHARYWIQAPSATFNRIL